MKTVWIAESRLTPPEPPADALPRGLAPADGRWPALTVLAAGPGWGKTQALAELLAAAPEGAIAAWLACDPYDADVAEVFHHLLASIRRQVPGFGTEVEALLAGGRTDARALWSRLFAALAAYGGPGAWLALDDAHFLAEVADGERPARPAGGAEGREGASGPDGSEGAGGRESTAGAGGREGTAGPAGYEGASGAEGRAGAGGPPLLKGLAAALERMPPGVHLLVATRRKLALPVARLSAQGRARSLGPAEVGFAPAEAAAYAAARGFTPDAALSEALAGWPLGWALAAGAGRDAAQVRDQLARGALADFVAEEQYLALDAPTRAFLRRAAWLDELAADDAAAVLGDAEAPARLAALEAAHLAIAHEGGAVHRLPAYLQAWLRAESRRVDPEATRAGWHQAAAARYEALGRPEAALPHRLAAGDWPAAALAAAAAFPAMRYSGRHAAIARWLGAFPPAVAEAEPLLLMWRGHGRARAGAHAEALDLYGRARAAYEAAGDAAGVVKAIVRLAYVALVENDLKQAGPLLMQAQARQADALPEDLADLHLSRGFIAEQRGDLALMRECHEAVLAVPAGREIEVAASHAVALINLHTAHLNLGAIEAADRAAARAIAVAAEWGFHPYGIFAAFLRAHLALLRTDPEGADEALRGLPATWREALDWHDLGCADTILGQRHQARGEWKEAEEAFRRATSTFEAAGFAQGLKLVAERQAWLALRRGQLARVAAIVAAAGLTGGSLYDVAPRLPQARALDLAGRPGEAIAVLDEAIAGFEGLGARLHATHGRLFRAAARRRTGDAAGAAADLAAAEAAMAGHGYEFLRGQDQLLWEELGAVGGGSRESRVPGPESLATPGSPLLAPARGPDPAAHQGRDREGALSAAASPPRDPGLKTQDSRLKTLAAPLHLTLLGALDARVGGVRVDQWQRRKAQLALACLALYPRGLALPELAELMGGEEPGGGRYTALKVAISYMRHALEPGLEKGAPSRFVLLEGERYRLAWDHVRLDVADFEAALAAGDRAKALALYHGNLLDEPFFHPYFEAEREKARGQAVSAALALAGEKHAAGDAAGAEALLTRIATVVGTDEAPYRALMDLYLAAGLADKARQAYWDCRKARKAQLGLPPSDELEAAYRAIR